MYEGMIRLYERHPWIRPLSEQIGCPDKVVENELNSASIQHWCGKREVDGNLYFMDAFAVLNNGSVMRLPLPAREKALWRRIVDFVKSYGKLWPQVPTWMTLEDVLRAHQSNIDRMAHVVLIGHQPLKHCTLMLSVFTPPHGSPISSILEICDLDRIEQRFMNDEKLSESVRREITSIRASK